MHRKLSFTEVLALSPEEYAAYKEWLHTQKTEEERAAEYAEYVRFAHPEHVEGDSYV